MLSIPQTQYAQSGEISIAYQVLGSGPIDLVVAPGFMSHLDYAWEEPSIARYLRRLASFSRLILFDKRGTGLSDRAAGIPSLEERIDDIRAVMDGAGSQRAAIFGWSEGGPMSILFAATYPERTQALILYATFARSVWAPDYPWADKVEDDEDDQDLGIWGSPAGIEGIIKRNVPSMVNDTAFREWCTKFVRMSASPGAAAALYRMNSDIDVRAILPTLHVPTLVIRRIDDQPAGEARYLAEHIPGARLVELQGGDHWPMFGDSDSIINEVQEFLTGERPAVDTDRILATVLFTDIVDSTKRVAEVGDRRWRDILDSHNALIHNALVRFRGRAIKSTGDGFLATFDGPARAIRCALAIRDEVQRLGLEIRAGLHTGEIELIGEDIGGIAVHTAARVAAKAPANEVWVTSTVRDLVGGSNLAFIERGVYELKGIPGVWNLFMAG